MKILKDKIFILWMVNTSLCLLIGFYLDMGLAILIAILMIPTFIHDILFKICKFCETKQENPTHKG